MRFSGVRVSSSREIGILRGASAAATASLAVCHHEEAFRPTRDLLFDRLKRKQIPRPTEVELVMTTYKFAMAQLKLRLFEATSCQ
jgi:hypothetical protein